MEYIYLISSTTQVKAIDLKNAFENKKDMQDLCK